MEYAKTFDSRGNQLLSIIHPSEHKSNVGVLIVVGGPQYRVGSHRQFVQLARAVANSGFTCMRFDYTGMGDSFGEKAEFDNVCDDIKSAIDALLEQQKEVEKVVVWGLCDAASASLIYGYQDPRVAGMVLLNPWLKSEQAQGKTMLKYYYCQRLFSKSFWKKLLTGKISLFNSANELTGHLKSSVATLELEKSSYQQRMLNGLSQFKGKLCWILSEDDLTAKEFEQQALSERRWHAINNENSSIHRVKNADHTFSSREYKRQVEAITIEFAKSFSGKIGKE
ncbi:hydrolase 1, exosortase A system-associated [Thalassotalea sp. M1531]|uniref:Hydrolase 1, exosortase A system-associated n=1 Tax=Thalassotalea algicola TaxID=2716224 RepID=A0A7Y0Q8M1_9GAMM|nr:hydrolase 1, exosortase A system-associated [Thalassotalea algicola]NMP33047.1 hydrolase 1, exosortase A system-associated [Thalassotalea algicola]